MSKTLSEPEFARAVDDALPKLVGVARRLAGDEDLAADAVQNALLKASKSWRRFRGDSHVHTWLTRIVIHCVRDGLAAEKRRTAMGMTQMQAEDQHEQWEDPKRGPTQKALDNESRTTILAAVRTLPDRQREVFGLMIWQGMTAREVGELLDIDPQAVHASLYAARKRLREKLGPYFEGDQES